MTYCGQGIILRKSVPVKEGLRHLKFRNVTGFSVSLRKSVPVKEGLRLFRKG